MKTINAGYLWPAQWKKPGDPIYPEWWSELPSDERPYHTQEDYDKYQAEMKKYPGDVVIDILPGCYNLEIDYPLETVYKKEIVVGEKGITRQGLMDLAASAYHEIYSYVNEGILAMDLDEDSDAYNKYGIWGHGIGDLTIHTFYVHEDNRITLGVDS